MGPYRAFLGLGLFAAACSTPVRPRGSAAQEPPDSTDAPPDDPFEPPNVALRLISVDANHGPTSGGNVVELQGEGLGDEATALEVRFDGRLVQPPDLLLDSPRSMRVVVPAGEVGPADVEVIVGDEIAVLPSGYRYDWFRVDPSRGSSLGGSRIRLTGTGTAWSGPVSVTLDGIAATDCEVLAPTQIECRTPPGETGPADVRVECEGFDEVVEKAFAYYESADPLGGGLGGGPIDGVVHVTVLVEETRLPHKSAHVILGSSADSPYRGMVDDLGQITFMGSDIVGPQQVTAACYCYEWNGFVDFDATDVTILLRKIPDCVLSGGRECEGFGE